MAKIPYIEWNPINSVHVEILDAQHRKLFDIVNDLIDEFEMGAPKLLPIIRDLVDYLAVHFHEEHKVMLESKFPDFLKHSQDHQKFTDKVEEFLQKYQEGDAELGLEMIVFMKEWVFNHTTRMDIKYGEHLRMTSDQKIET